MEVVRFFMKNLNFLWRSGGRLSPRTSHTPRNELFACVLGANPRISSKKVDGRREFLIINILFLSKSSPKTHEIYESD